MAQETHLYKQIICFPLGIHTREIRWCLVKLEHTLFFRVHKTLTV